MQLLRLLLLVAFALASLLHGSSLLEQMLDECPDLLQEHMFSILGPRKCMNLRALNRFFHGMIPVVHSLAQDEQVDLLDLLSLEKVPYKSVVDFLSVHRWYRLDFLDAEGNGVLYWALFKQNSADIFSLLHLKGASLTDPSAMKPVLGCLLYLSQGLKVLEYILSNGGVVGVHGQWNFLYCVALMTAEKHFRVLCDYGVVQALINLPDAAGRTPIFGATIFAVARDLIAIGADVYWTDHRGLTARQSHLKELGGLQCNKKLMAYLSGDPSVEPC